MPITDKTIRAAILELLDQREAGKSICPSEAARRVSPEDWRPLMPQVRQVANELISKGMIIATQRGKRVDPVAARGPIRLSKPVD